MQLRGQQAHEIPDAHQGLPSLSRVVVLPHVGNVVAPCVFEVAELSRTPGKEDEHFVPFITLRHVAEWFDFGFDAGYYPLPFR